MHAHGVFKHCVGGSEQVARLLPTWRPLLMRRMHIMSTVAAAMQRTSVENSHALIGRVGCGLVPTTRFAQLSLSRLAR